MYVCVCVWVPSKMVWDPMELDLQVAVSYPVRVLGIELRFSRRAGITLN